MTLSKLDNTGSSPDNNIQTREWTEQAMAGDYSAFEYLYLFYYQGIEHYLTARLGNLEDAQDCTQDTFLKAWQKLPSLQDACSFKSWLYQIAINIAHNRFRRQKIIQWLSLGNLVSSSVEELYSLPGPENQIEERIFLEQVRAKVSEKYWNCVVLQKICGFPQRDIAKMLKISKESVSKYVSRGLEQMREVSLHLNNDPTTGVE